MSRSRLMSIVLACGLAAVAVAGGSAAAPAAVEVSAATIFSRGTVQSISCVAVGECAAGGSYRWGFTHEAFVVSEKNGHWGVAIDVPGMSALATAGVSYVSSISCVAAGECAATGVYSEAPLDSPHQQTFVVSETHGSWGNAIEVPGTAALNTGGDAASWISCASVGNCAVGGFYAAAGHLHAFVADETNGSWSNAIEVPGTGGYASVSSISCPEDGECTAVGSASGDPFVVSETNGSWGNAIEVPGMATLNPDGYAELNSVSCAAAGECAAAGYYLDGSGRFEAFVVDETNGSWGNAIEVPGMATLNVGGYGTQVRSISCAAPGECAAGGNYDDGSGWQAFVVDETNGSWGNAIEVPGTAKLNTGGPGPQASVYSISCSAAGECAAGGYYTVHSVDRLDPGRSQAFVVDETKGSWGSAIKEPGGAVRSVACVTAGTCSAGYVNGVLGETNGEWDDGVQVLVPCVVPNVVGKAIGPARKKLNAADCRVGKITNMYSTTKKGLVVAQRKNPNSVLGAGASVALVLSKGGRR